MATFNLLNEPWIPVLDSDVDLRVQPQHSVQLREIGLRDVFASAHEIREVYSDAPLETVALYRLLLALFIDAYLPEPDEDAWMALWKQGRFDPDKLEHYLDEHKLHTHFDLLDPERPFYQHPQPHPSTAGKDPAPLAKLFHAEASGNNATLFGHELDTAERYMKLAEAARGLVCMQAAALGGGVSKPFNLSHAPLVGGAVFWIRGRTLFDALLLNAPPYEKARMFKKSAFGQDLDDRPAWRQVLSNKHARRAPAGYLDYLTWQARRLTLVTEEDPAENVVATGVYLTQGDKDEPAVGHQDPLMARVESKKKGIFPFGFRADKALWRDADILFTLAAADDKGAPQTFQWLIRLADTAYPYDAPELEAQGWFVDVFGIVNDKAKVEQWRHERMPVYEVFLEDFLRLSDLQKALEYAEEQSRILKDSVRTVAEYILNPPSPGSTDPHKPDKKAVNKLVDSLDVESRYWAALAPKFYALLSHLAQEPDAALRREHVWEWAKTIYKTAQKAFRTGTSMLDQNARVLRAVAEGQRRLWHVKAYRDHQKIQKEEAA